MTDVSIIMAIKDRVDSLQRCLQSYTKLSYKNYELIIVDDGSRNAYPRVIEHYEDILPISYHYLTSDHDRLPNFAWNHGYSKSSGDFIIFTSGDLLLVDSDLIERYLEHFGKQRMSVLTYKLNQQMTYALDRIDWFNNPKLIQELPGFWTEPIDGEANDHRLLAGLTTYMTAQYRKDWEWFGLFRNEEGHLFADHDLVMRDYALGRGVDTLPNIVIYHQWHSPPLVKTSAGYHYENEIQARLRQPAPRDKS